MEEMKYQYKNPKNNYYNQLTNRPMCDDDNSYIRPKKKHIHNVNNNNKNYYNQLTKRPICDDDDNNYNKNAKKTIYNDNHLAKNNLCNVNNNYYNKLTNRPICGVNNFYKVTVVNIHSTNVQPYSMSCDDCEYNLDTIIDESNNVTNVCRRGYGNIHSSAGLYELTIWKTQSTDLT